MRRRFLLASTAANALSPTFAEAQQKSLPLIGMLSPFSSTEASSWEEAFRRGLYDLGWVEGKDVVIEYRYADGVPERLADLAADLVRRKVDVIVAQVTNGALAARKATSVLPIVIVATGDPVETGLVHSLARPQGNVTGISQNIVETAGKRLEMLKQVIPDLTDAAVLWKGDDPSSIQQWHTIQVASEPLSVRLQSLPVLNAASLDSVLGGAVGTQVRALYVVASPLIIANLKRIADFAIKHRLASIFLLPEFTRVGGLMSFGPNRRDQFRRAATYVDKILKGAKPADLPIEQPTSFELVINLRTAKVLGLALSPTILARADEVIE